MAAPTALRHLLSFRRLSASAYTAIAKVVEEDGEFRRRVAAAAPTEEDGSLGRADWLWLHRPDGWTEDPAWAGAAEDPVAEPDAGSARQRRQRAAAEAKADRHRQAAAEADDARRRAVEQLADARAEAAEAGEQRNRLQGRLAELEGERNQAVRTSKALESDLAEARRKLRVSRAATRQAEAELLAVRPDPSTATASAPTPAAGVPGGGRRRSSQPAPEQAAPATVVDPLDRAAVAGAVGAAAAASADLAQAVAQAAAASTSLAKALAAAAMLLSPPAAVPPEAPALDVGERAAGRSVGPGRPAGRRRPRRVPPTLPPGVFADTPEAHRHLIGSGEPLVVVDGYNLARSAWSDLTPEEERRRTVALLEEVQARAGGPVVVVFDGDDAAVAPAASRSLRVRFSSTGVTADDDIAAFVAQVPPGQPVVVVSSDREVATEARRQGAAVLSSPEFLAAARR